MPRRSRRRGGGSPWGKPLLILAVLVLLAGVGYWWKGRGDAPPAKEVATAANHFNTILARWPADAVAPDAMLGLANSQQALGDAKASQRTLQSVVERYPESTAAKAARQRLGIR